MCCARSPAASWRRSEKWKILLRSANICDYFDVDEHFHFGKNGTQKGQREGQRRIVNGKTISRWQEMLSFVDSLLLLLTYQVESKNEFICSNLLLRCFVHWPPSSYDSKYYITCRMQTAEKGCVLRSYFAFFGISEIGIKTKIDGWYVRCRAPCTIYSPYFFFIIVAGSANKIYIIYAKGVRIEPVNDDSFQHSRRGWKQRFRVEVLNFEERVIDILIYSSWFQGNEIAPNNWKIDFSGLNSTVASPITKNRLFMFLGTSRGRLQCCDHIRSEQYFHMILLIFKTCRRSGT